jgi:hypothetical protein
VVGFTTDSRGKVPEKHVKREEKIIIIIRRKENKK